MNRPYVPSGAFVESTRRTGGRRRPQPTGEHPPVKAKGIAGDIRCFALKNFLGADAQRSFVVKERPGMRLTVNLAQLSGDARQKALSDLQEVMDRIRREP